MMNYMQFPGGRQKALTLSYDDGVQQDIRMMEILDKHGIKCTFNINGYSFEEEERSYAEGQIHRRMARREAIEVYSKAMENGHEIATHGYSHPFLDKLPPEMVAYEIVEDRKCLEEMFGTIIKGHAYPFGTTSNQVVETLRNCGILYARTTVSTKRFDVPTDWLRMPATCHHNASDLMQLVDQFLNEPVRYLHPKLFYLWGHTYEFDTNNNWEVIEQICQKLANNDEIWYATNIEIADYMQVLKRLQYFADMSYVYNPSAASAYLRVGQDIVEVPGGCQVKLM